MPVKILPEPFEFEWDKWNVDKNWIKHKVTNREAEDVFIINQFLLLEDELHSVSENRYFVIGLNRENKILTLIITLRGHRVRVISARPANKKERIFYEKTLKNS